MKLSRLLPILMALALCLPAAAEKRVLGKLGQATSPTKIYSSMSTRSRVYYSVKQYEYLVVNPSRSQKWVKVLMQNGMSGYATADAVARLPYEVTAEVATSRPGAGPALASRTGSAIANYSLNFIGTPYVWGGNDPNRGVDCSGFVKQMFGQIAGVSLPRTAAEQVNVGKPITRLEDLRSGDRLYFWDAKRGKVGHTGIYLGNGYFVHSSRTHNGVNTDYLGSKKWLKILVAARR
jgi:cell wall-associated NlpC family hydrolase